MPVFFQQQINDTTRLGVWKIEETEDFFKSNVPVHRDVTHPHKRLQHLAGRFLLQYLFPDFPYELIQIADTRKPFIPDERYHFSISHCGDYAGAIVSSDSRVGIDVEIPTYRTVKILHKFLSGNEIEVFSLDGLKTQQATNNIQYSNHENFKLPTLLWSAKETVFKWYGDGSVDFKEHIHLKNPDRAHECIECYFSKNDTNLEIHFREFDHLILTWVVS